MAHRPLGSARTGQVCCVTDMAQAQPKPALVNSQGCLVGKPRVPAHLQWAGKEAPWTRSRNQLASSHPSGHTSTQLGFFIYWARGGLGLGIWPWTS